MAERSIRIERSATTIRETAVGVCPDIRSGVESRRCSGMNPYSQRCLNPRLKDVAQLVNERNAANDEEGLRHGGDEIH